MAVGSGDLDHFQLEMANLIQKFRIKATIVPIPMPTSAVSGVHDIGEEMLEIYHTQARHPEYVDSEADQQLNKGTRRNSVDPDVAMLGELTISTTPATVFKSPGTATTTATTTTTSTSPKSTTTPAAETSPSRRNKNVVMEAATLAAKNPSPN